MKIKYEISDFMTLDEFEKYVNDNIIPTLNSFESEDREGRTKYFLLIMEYGKFEELDELEKEAILDSISSDYYSGTFSTSR